MGKFDLNIYGDYCPQLKEGTWAYKLTNMDDGCVIEKIGNSYRKETANRMQLKAILEVFKQIPDGACVTLKTNNHYVVDGLMKWRFGWDKQGWRGVENRDLWKIVHSLVQKYKFHVLWVKKIQWK